MIEVSINFYGVIRDTVDKREIEITLPDEATVKDLIEFLVKKYGNKFKERVLDPEGNLRKSVKLSIGDRVIRNDGMDERLKSKNSSKSEVTIFIFPQLGGGI